MHGGVPKMRVSESSRLSILVKELVESIPDLH